MICVKLTGMCEGCEHLAINYAYSTSSDMSDEIELMCLHQRVCEMWYKHLKEADRKHRIEVLDLTSQLHSALDMLNESTPKSDG